MCKQHKTTRNEESDADSEVKHRHGNSVASLQYTRVDKLIIYITIHKQKHSFTSYPTAKHQNTANFDLQTYEKDQWTFLWYRKRIDFASCNNLANRGSFAKVSVPVYIYNSLVDGWSFWEITNGQYVCRTLFSLSLSMTTDFCLSMLKFRAHC